jgi:pimeloyl-ACP methyl ester carboxylesterase
MTMVIGLRHAGNFPLAIVVPWGDLLLGFVGLPLLAFLGAWFGGKGPSSGARGAEMARSGVVGAVVVAIGVSVAGGVLAAEPLRWEPHVGEAFDGSPLAGEWTHIVVPENRSRPNGRTIRLAVVRYRTTHPDPGPPIVYLAGGPGGSGVELAGREATHPQVRLLESRDVIGFDQRGTGRTEPSFDWPEFGLPLAADRPATREDVAAAWDRAVARCVAYWRAAGVDTGAYDTEASADDVDDIRRALGLERIALYGESYGSHLGLACLRRHPESIERAFLARVEGPDDTWKLPSTTQRALEALHERLRESGRTGAAYEDLIGTIRRLSARLDRAPIATVTGPTGMPGEDFVIGSFDLKCAVARMLGHSARAQSEVPELLQMLEGGASPSLADWVHLRREAPVTLMPLLMDCASGGSPERLARIERERRDPDNVLGDALMAPFFPSACHGAGAHDPGADYRKPLRCTVPVLFVSGTLDARTPPENVEALLPGFTQAVHVVAENAGHESRELMAPEYRALFQAFWRGEPVASCRILLPPEAIP